MNTRDYVIAIACYASLFTGCGRPDPADSPPAPPAVPVELKPQKSVEELIATINDDPYELHFDFTPSGDALIKMGHPVVPRVLELMLSPSQVNRDDPVLHLSADDATRMRAQRVLEAIIADEDFGRRRPGMNGNWDNEGFREFWKSLGNLQWDDPEEDRRKSVQKWKEWLANRKKA